MSSEHGARLAGNHIYLSRDDVAQIEAEARAALRAELRAAVERLVVTEPGASVPEGVSPVAAAIRDTGWNDAVDRVLRLLTDGAEPPEGGNE